MFLHVEKSTLTTITLNRPEVHNALNDRLLTELTVVLKGVEEDPTIRGVILRGAGKSFCAGADLNWMQSMVTYSQEENYQDSLKLDTLMYTLNTLSKPTIAVVHGNVYGGGVGLVACCDIALAECASQFCLSETKLGLIPAVISPYVIEAIGARSARRYFQTAEIFSAVKAQELGLIHEVTEKPLLEETLTQITTHLLKGGPRAQTQTKKLIREVAYQPINKTLRQNLAQRIADIRVSIEAQHGLQAFLTKSHPEWDALSSKGS